MGSFGSGGARRPRRSSGLSEEVSESSEDNLLTFSVDLCPSDASSCPRRRPRILHAADVASSSFASCPSSSYSAGDGRWRTSRTSPERWTACWSAGVPSEYRTPSWPACALAGKPLQCLSIPSSDSEGASLPSSAVARAGHSDTPSLSPLPQSHVGLPVGLWHGSP